MRNTITIVTLYHSFDHAKIPSILDTDSAKPQAKSMRKIVKLICLKFIQKSRNQTNKSKYTQTLCELPITWRYSNVIVSHPICFIQKVINIENVKENQGLSQKTSDTKIPTSVCNVLLPKELKIYIYIVIDCHRCNVIFLKSLHDQFL